jgi:hypothetical protein
MPHQESAMETVTVVRPFERDIEDMVSFCRTMKSREAWPGAVPSYAGGQSLVYNVSLHLSAATLTDIEIDEKLNEVTKNGDGSVAFGSTQRVTWPTGHADASTEYLFRPGAAGEPNTLQFTYSYEPPSTKLVKTKALPEFRAGMEKVATVYLKSLTAVAPVS